MLCGAPSTGMGGSLLARSTIIIAAMVPRKTLPPINIYLFVNVFVLSEGFSCSVSDCSFSDSVIKLSGFTYSCYILIINIWIKVWMR